MPKPFIYLEKETFEAELHDLLFNQITDILSDRQQGHCMSIADLDLSLTTKLAQSLRQKVPTAQVHILADSMESGRNGGNNPDDLYITSTKLVELRNPLADGSLRYPLLVFLPPNLHTNAEDSFNVASFEALNFSGIYAELRDKLIQQVPSPLQGYIREIFRRLQSEHWPWAGTIAQTRFLLAAIHNGNDGATLGASLYELGLIPDFLLFEDPTRLQGRLQKNHQCVQDLIGGDTSVRTRILNLEIIDTAITHQLTDLLLNSTIEDPQSWTSQIVLHQENWGLSFDKWKFSQEINPDSIAIDLTAIDLPIVEEQTSDEKLLHLVGSQILNPQERKKLKVTFKVDPHPSKVQHLEYFTVQIISQEQGSIGSAKRVKAWNQKALVKNVTLDKLDKLDLDEGWHLIRIQAWAEDGTKIPLVEEEKGQLEDSKPQNESDLFYIVLNVELDDLPQQRAVPKDASLEHAKLALQFTALNQGQEPQEIQPSEIIWSKPKDGQDSLEVKFGRAGKRQIPVFTELKTIEQAILEDPKSLATYQLAIDKGKPQDLEQQTFELPTSLLSQSFLISREKYFNAISGNKKLVSQAADFSALREEAFQYAEEYRNLLVDLKTKIERSTGRITPLLEELKQLLAIDTVQITITDFRGHYREALLLGPTHPLRVLWLATWSQMGQEWLQVTDENSGAGENPMRRGLLKDLAPLNVPFALPQQGRVFVTVDSLHPFWALYSKADDTDPRGLLGEVSSSLKVHQIHKDGNSINSEVIFKRIDRYLKQHAYISTLKINVFNPGRGEVLADVLKTLNNNPDLKSLHYDLCLFALDPEASSLGEALMELFSPNSSIGDAFSGSTGNHLFPKLNLAVHSIEDFRQNPKSYDAHLGILFDLFPAREVSASYPMQTSTSSPINGLIQSFSVTYYDDKEGALWQRQPIHPKLSTLNEDGFNRLLVEVEELFSGSLATIATQEAAFDKRLVIKLALRSSDRQLLKDIHESCNWVFTIDRNLGIEFFDQGGDSNRPPYIVDYVPTGSRSFGHNLIVTSRSLTELEITLSKVLEKYELPRTPLITRGLLEQLRALSGQLALKLLSSRQHQAEVLGLALARIFLSYQGALANQIIVPLDSHQDLFQTSKTNSSDVTSLKRTDLALFDLNLVDRQITCNLVEVKCYTNAGGLQQLNDLKLRIADQINNSENVLRDHFEKNDSLGYLLKTDDFAGLLQFYLDRASRYKAIEEESLTEIKQFIQTIQEGYSLQFTRSGLIFDFSMAGTEPADHENGVEYYRIGSDLIRDLVQALEAAPTATTTEFNSTQTRIDSVPVLTSAAFISPRRDRSRSVNSLDSTPQELNDHQEGNSPDQPPLNPEPVVEVEAQEIVVDQDSNMFPPMPEESIVSSGRLTEREDTEYQVPQESDVTANEENDPPASISPLQFPTGTAYDVLLGTQSDSPQYGLLGTHSGRKVAIDLNQTHTISLFGVQGAGKSYTLGSIAEMACIPISGINQLPSPLATIIFHYSPTQDYKPEFTSMVNPNAEATQIESLKQQYGAAPQALEEVLILCPASKIEQRKAEYPNIEIRPIHFASAELKINHWKFLMGAVGSQSMYIRQINMIMKKLRKDLTLDRLLQNIENSSIPDHIKDLAKTRLDFAAEYIDDDSNISQLIQPGRLIIVDLRDEFIEKDEALGLFVVLLQIFSEVTHSDRPFNKLVVFDEAHKYIENSDLISGLIEVVREMRHKGTSIMVASQDPPSVPISLIELSSQIILHRFNSPAWLKHIQKANAALNNLSPKLMSQLESGEAYVWSSKATDQVFSQQAMKVICRPRVTRHGGDTQTAVN